MRNLCLKYLRTQHGRQIRAGIAVTKENNLCLGVLREVSIFKPGIDVTVTLKAIAHFLADSGNKISVFYNPARGAGTHELAPGIKMDTLKAAEDSKR